MPHNRYCIYKKHRWVQVDLITGRLDDGSGLARFVVHRGGSLHLEKRRKVLRELRKLASGLPSAVNVGMPLPHVKRYNHRHKVRSHCHCKQVHCKSKDDVDSVKAFPRKPTHVNSTDINDNFKVAEKSEEHNNAINKIVSTATVHEQRDRPAISSSSLPAGKSVQLTAQSLNKEPDIESYSEPVDKPGPLSSKMSYKKSSKKPKNVGNSQNDELMVHEGPKSITKKQNISTEDEITRVEHSKTSDKQSDQDSDAAELIISFEDVELLGAYLKKNKMLDIDAEAYTRDVEYRDTVLYRLHPNVRLEKDKEVDMLAMKLHGRDSDSDISLKEFAKILGLGHVDDVETKLHRYKTRERSRPHIERSSGSEKEKENRKATNVKSNRDSGQFKHALKEKLVVDSNRKNEVRHLKTARNELKTQSKVTDSDSSFFLKSKAKINDKLNSFKRLLPKRLSHKKSEPDASVYVSDSDDLQGTKDNENSKLKHIVARTKHKWKQQKLGFLRGTHGGASETHSGTGGDRDRAVLRRKPIWKQFKRREYSPNEDQAIVAFVNNGDRPEQVNGNQLWRELQGTYPRLTNKHRTWQSLRNRYLRYILPALGALALPPQLQRELRAAAAKGKINLRRKESAAKRANRRNSLVEKLCRPVQSASLRRAAPRPETDSDETTAQPATRPRRHADHDRSPTRASQRDKVAGEFAKQATEPERRDSGRRLKTASGDDKGSPSPRATRLRTSGSALTQSPSRRSPPAAAAAAAAAAAPRTRRLYNPRAAF